MVSIQGPDPVGAYGMGGGPAPWTIYLELMGQTRPLGVQFGWGAGDQVMSGAECLHGSNFRKWQNTLWSCPYPCAPQLSPAGESSLNTLEGVVQVGNTVDSFWVKCASSTWNSSHLCSCDSLRCVNSITSVQWKERGHARMGRFIRAEIWFPVVFRWSGFTEAHQSCLFFVWKAVYQEAYFFFYIRI